MYVTGDFCHLWMHNGTHPFTNETLAEQPATWPWSSFTSGERWLAFTNASGYGVGVVTPFVSHFGAGYYNNGANGAYDCVPKGLGPTDSPTGYIAPWENEIIDPRAPYAYKFALVLGSLASIRAYAAAEHAAGRDEPLPPQYDFVGRGDRAHCTYSDAQDACLPVGPRGLQLNVTGPHPMITGPTTLFAPLAISKIMVNASLDASLSGVTAALWFERLGDAGPCADCVVLVAAPADGAFHVLEFDLAGTPAWASAPAIQRIIFQPLGAAAVPPAVYGRIGIAAVTSITSV